MTKFLAALAIAAAIALGTAAGAQAAIKSEPVTYSAGGQELTGYIVYDDAIAGKRPGILVVHEWWGHDEYARRRAHMLAAQGYVAFALDMYGSGRLADHPKDAGAMAKEVLSTKGLMQERFLAAKELIKAHPMVVSSKIGAVGYCFGGNVILDMARAGVDLKAVAAFHASMTQTIPATPGSVKAKVKVFNGAADPFIKPENLQKFKVGMRAAGADFEYIAYPDVVHSFTSPGATARGQKLGLPLAYDSAADQDSWMKTLELFREVF